MASSNSNPLFTFLPNEVLLQVIELIESDRQTLLNLRLASKQAERLATRYVFKHLKLQKGAVKSTAQMKGLMRRGIQEYVEEFTMDVSSALPLSTDLQAAFAGEFFGNFGESRAIWQECNWEAAYAPITLENVVKIAVMDLCSQLQEDELLNMYIPEDFEEEISEFFCTLIRFLRGCHSQITKLEIYESSELLSPAFGEHDRTPELCRAITCAALSFAVLKLELPVLKQIRIPIRGRFRRDFWRSHKSAINIAEYLDMYKRRDRDRRGHQATGLDFNEKLWKIGRLTFQYIDKKTTACLEFQLPDPKTAIKKMTENDRRYPLQLCLRALPWQTSIYSSVGEYLPLVRLNVEKAIFRYREIHEALKYWPDLRELTFSRVLLWKLMDATTRWNWVLFFERCVEKLESLVYFNFTALGYFIDATASSWEDAMRTLRPIQKYAHIFTSYDRDALEELCQAVAKRRTDKGLPPEDGIFPGYDSEDVD